MTTPTKQDQIIKQQMANDLVDEALKLGAERQHESAAMQGEIPCTESPCIFCQAIAVRLRAIPEQIEEARYLHQTNDIEIDDDALVSIANEGYWVGAWVWVDDDKPETEEQGDNDNE